MRGIRLGMGALRSTLSGRLGGGITLPVGALGVWYADTYSATPRPHVPNSASALAAPANLYNAPRRMFNNGAFWALSSITAVDDAATAPDGSLEASTLNFVAGGFLKGAGGYTLPAGTYTLACSVKRNTGTDQQFCFHRNNTATRSAARTAGAAWTNEAFTFTTGAPVPFGEMGLITIDGVTAANIQVCDLRVFAGSTDLGPGAPVAHLLPGINAYDTRPAYAAGELDLSALQAAAVIQLPANVSTSAGITFQAVVRKISGAVNFEAALSQIQDFTAFAAWFNSSGGAPTSFANSTFNDTGLGASAEAAGLWDFLNKGVHVLTWRYDPATSTEEIFLDDARMRVRKVAITARNIRDLFVNSLVSTAYGGGRKYAGLALWNSALTDAQILQGYKFWKARAALSSITVSGDTTNRLLVSEGHSIPATNASYVYQSGPNLTLVTLGTSFAVSGSTLATVVTRASFVDRVILNGVGTKKVILSLNIGANDVGTYAGATDAIAAASYTADLATYCDARRAAGFKVVMCTILPISGNTAHNTRRAIINSNITSSWVGTHCDAIADFAANATMGGDASFTNFPADWTDTIHPNTAGHTILEPIYRAAVNSL